MVKLYCTVRSVSIFNRRRGNFSEIIKVAWYAYEWTPNNNIDIRCFAVMKRFTERGLKHDDTIVFYETSEKIREQIDT